jgi:hypothetical protein
MNVREYMEKTWGELSREMEMIYTLVGMMFTWTFFFNLMSYILKTCILFYKKHPLKLIKKTIVSI